MSAHHNSTSEPFVTSRYQSQQQMSARGLASNQVSYTFSKAERIAPFRELLKPGIHIKWDSTLEALFYESKMTITSEIETGMQIFEVPTNTLQLT